MLSGTVTDPTGAVVRGATAHLTAAPAAASARGEERRTDGFGEFTFTAPPGTYVLTVEAPGFEAYTSAPLTLKINGRLRLPVHLAVAGLHEQIDILDDETGSIDAAGSTVFEGDSLKMLSNDFEGDSLKMLSNDAATLQQQLSALAGGLGTIFVVDGFSGGRLPPKSSIRSIRINRNQFSAYYAEPGARVEISTKPGGDKLHGLLNLSGTNQPWDARDPYTAVQLPFYEFQEEGNVNGPLNQKTSFFASELVDSLANSVAVNAANPANLSSTFSTELAAPQLTQTYGLRLDRQFSPTNFAFIRDEWSNTRITNSGINPLVLPDAAYSLNTLTNTLQLADTQVVSAHAVNEVRFQYLRTRVQRNPNSAAPSILVEGSFQNGGSPSQFLRDNQDAYELQDLFEVDRGRHSVRTGFRFRAVRDANRSTAGFNGQYIFPDAASFLAQQPTQYSQTVGQQNAVLRTDDIGVFAEDDWKLSTNLTLSYGLRFESQSAIPDHVDPAPRVGFSWAVRPGKRKTPIVTLRGGYGLFYDRFPAAQLLQAVRQNGTREVTYLQQNPGYAPLGPPPGFTPSASQPTVYQVDPRLRSSYGQFAMLTVSRTLGRFGAVSGNFTYMHNAHNYLTENINAPLPGSFTVSDPSSGVRPLGTAANIYQFSSAANGNTERFYISYHVQVGKQISAFGVLDTEKDRNETDGITSFPSNQYNLRQDYGRTAIDRTVAYTGGFTWTLPYGFQLTPFLVAHTGLPFDITTGTDSNGDTIYNDRPALAAGGFRPSVVQTAFGAFDVAPAAGTTPIPRDFGRAPSYVWLQLQAAKDFHIGPRPRAAATGADVTASPRPDRPWDLSFNVEVHNITNHNNPGVPVGVISAQPCGAANTAGCTCPVMAGQCALAPSQYFGHSLSLASDFSPITASNRTILLQSSFTF